MFHCESDISAHNWLIDHPTKNQRNPQPVSEESKFEQKRLLQKTSNFVHSNKCRRLELLKYLEAEENEYKKLIINEQCCDNCKIALNGGIPPKLLYEDILENGTVDCTLELRLFLQSIRECGSLQDSISLLVGQTPLNTIGCTLQNFGIGRNNSREYWAAIARIASEKSYTDLQFPESLNKKAKTFLRNNLKKEFGIPRQPMFSTMRKRENLNFYWDNNEIKSRPKTNDEMIIEKYGIPAGVQEDLTKEESEQIEYLLSEEMMNLDDENENETVQKSEENLIDLTRNEKEIVEKTMSGLTAEDFVDLTCEEEDIIKQTMSGIKMDDFIDLMSDEEEEKSNPSKKQRLQ